METHSSVLAWRIPGTEEPGGMPSMGSIESDTTGDLAAAASDNHFAFWHFFFLGMILITASCAIS